MFLCVLVFLFPCVAALPVSLSFTPVSFIPVSVTPCIFSSPVLEVVLVLSLVLSSCLFSHVLALSFPEASNPVTLVSVSILPLHYSIAMSCLILPSTIVHQSAVLVIASVLEGSLPPI